MYKYRQRNEDCQKEVYSFVLVSLSSKNLNLNDQCNSVPTLLTRFFKSTNVPEND